LPSSFNNCAIAEQSGDCLELRAGVGARVTAASAQFETVTALLPPLTCRATMIARWLKRKPDVAGQMETARLAYAEGRVADAIAIWLPLAHAGVGRAQNNIGACLIDGAGVEADQATGAKWLIAAAENGDRVGQRNLASAYFKGTGVEPNEAEAARWYRKAAEQGDAEAQDMLSWMLCDSEGIARDYEEAMKWATAAAEQGIAPAMTRIGMLHHNALGVERNPALAAEWWRKAAEKGDADGQAMLGAAYQLGAGVVRDPVTAMTWLIRAKRGGSLLAENYYNALSAQLSPDELGRAEAEAKR
jgi:hypothetical protein